MTRNERPAGASEAAAQQEMQTIAEDLMEIEGRLRAVHQSLEPPAEVEEAQDLDDEMDLATQLRTAIDCLLTDNLEPAIRDLQAAAALRGR